MSTPAYAQGAQLALLKLGMLPEPKGPDISKTEARQVEQKLRIDPSKYPIEAVREGVETELEHTKDPYFAGKISLDHLKESPRYYTELKKMEAKLDKTDDKTAASRYISKPQAKLLNGSLTGKKQKVKAVVPKKPLDADILLERMKAQYKNV